MNHLYLAFVWHNFKRYFRHAGAAKMLTMLGFGAVFVLVGWAVFHVFRGGFFFLDRQEELIRIALHLYIYDVFFLFVGVLVFLSALISGYFFLFRGQDSWIMATPGWRSLAWWKLAQCTLGAAWPLLALALPALAAVSTLYPLGALTWGIILAGGVLTVLLLCLTAMGGLLLLAAGCAVLAGGARTPLFRSKAVFLLTLFLLLSWGAWALWGMVFHQDFEQLFGSNIITTPQQSVAFIDRHFAPLPTHFGARIVFAGQYGALADALATLAHLGLWTVGALVIYFCAGRLHLRGWQFFQEGNLIASGEKNITGICEPAPFPRFLRGATGALCEKEWLTLTRDPKNALWFFFLLGLFGLQAGLNFLVGRNATLHGTDELFEPLFVLVLQVGTVSFFLCAFALRFIFPSLSMEGKGAWLLGSAPINLRRVFWAKWLFFVGLFEVLGLLFFLWCMQIVGLSGVVSWVALLVLALMMVFLITLALSLGTLFPDFEADDPQSASTTLPGFALTLLGVGYCVGGALALHASLLMGNHLWLMGGIIASVVLLIFLLYYVPRAAQKIALAGERA